MDLTTGENIIIPNAGWHFSYTENPVYKLDNFTHSEYNCYPYNTIDYLKNCIKNLKNPFHPSNKMEVIFDNDQLKSFLPKYVVENMDEYLPYILTEELWNTEFQS
jgi:hypothetical protein